MGEEQQGAALHKLKLTTWSPKQVREKAEDYVANKNNYVRV